MMLPRHIAALGLAPALVIGVGLAGPSVATISQNPPLLGRQSPPQPQQKRGPDYFAGTWRFSWTGRESAITSGPRIGTITFERAGDANQLSTRTEGTSDASGPYKESGTLTWNEERKTLTIQERLASGVEISGVGDWSSPIGIQFESAPLQVSGQTIRLKRTYAILSASSFNITEEVSTDGGPYARLGTGAFVRADASK